jgi:hypothetical protein
MKLSESLGKIVEEKKIIDGDTKLSFTSIETVLSINSGSVNSDHLIDLLELMTDDE